MQRILLKEVLRREDLNLDVAHKHMVISNSRGLVLERGIYQTKGWDLRIWCEGEKSSGSKISAWCAKDKNQRPEGQEKEKKDLKSLYALQVSTRKPRASSLMGSHTSTLKAAVSQLESYVETLKISSLDYQRVQNRFISTYKQSRYRRFSTYKRDKLDLKLIAKPHMAVMQLQTPICWIYQLAEPVKL